MAAVARNEQRARVFRNGRSRAVRIPKEFDFEGDEVTIRKEADGTLSIVPDRKRMSPPELIAWLRAQPAMTPEDASVRFEFGDAPPRPIDFEDGT